MLIFNTLKIQTLKSGEALFLHKKKLAKRTLQSPSFLFGSMENE